MSDRPDTRRDNESATSSLAGGLSITLDEPAAEPVSPVGIVFPQENFELRANNPPTSNTNDGRSKSEHWREDPHFIADYLAHNSSKAAAVFRRYDKLAVYRLLLLSRELDGLEKKHNICTSGKIGSQEYAETLEAGGFGNAVGSTVKEYYDLLLAYSQVLHLDPPAERTVEAIDRYVSTPGSHEGKSWWGYRLKYRLKGKSGEMTRPDLVSLFTPAENDYISKFVDKWLYHFFLTPESKKKATRKADEEANENVNDKATYVNEQKMQKFVTFVGTIISIGFLISAMWVLWRLEDNTVAKLATVTAFVVTFAGWLGFLTTAQRKDVIAATAAYAAVLVVFVSQQSPVTVTTQGTGTVVT